MSLNCPHEAENNAEVENNTTVNFPLREIPGSYGKPFFGPLLDRLKYFHFQGKEKYFASRVKKYQSTVFRANMPPGPFISSDSKVVVLLDAKSFPILFDVTKVEKKDVFTGTYVPSTKLTGGYRVLAYLDPSEPNHCKLKQLLFFLFHSRREFIIPEFRTSLCEMFDTLERKVATKGKARFDGLNDKACFNFVCRSFFSTNPADTKLGIRGVPTKILVWILFQISPIASTGLPCFLEEPLFHTCLLPPCLMKQNYKKLYDFFYTYSGWILDEAEKMGIEREEACHNLLFAACFNAFGAMRIFFPILIKWIGCSGVKVHKQLADEIRSAVACHGGNVTVKAIEEMPLLKSAVYEALRIEPPVPFQYATAKKDLVIESHESTFEVKQGELLLGYQPFATKDPKVFDRAEDFVADRFVGVEGEKLLKYVVWSNGPETENTTVENKQCAAKDIVVLVARLLLVELFLRYDTFEVKIHTSPLFPLVTFTSVTKSYDLSLEKQMQ
ncbi:hypothetical protein C5167_038245 [Papaver somniferum]|uniref:Allene oxide synthase n=1 Tax=Papaver somniferum TaxID=3469 RepID=A0A4Y7ID03_PAPSO|nr:allene oxide synthase-like [Papaver somniferum]RZC45305.1 hypothetical protein C5167_038245 [Papaver somniferum]